MFFIEVGILKVERDTGDTATRRGSDHIKGLSTSTLGGVDCTKTGTATSKACLNTTGPSKGIASESSENQTFRLARLGVGWVVGTMEFFHRRRPGRQVALDYCRLHHLPFSKIQDVEAEDPIMVLKLYKLLSYLMAQRQEATNGQLATLHSIMSSPAR